MRLSKVCSAQRCPANVTKSAWYMPSIQAAVLAPHTGKFGRQTRLCGARNLCPRDWSAHAIVIHRRGHWYPSPPAAPHAPGSRTALAITPCQLCSGKTLYLDIFYILQGRARHHEARCKRATLPLQRGLPRAHCRRNGTEKCEALVLLRRCLAGCAMPAAPPPA